MTRTPLCVSQIFAVYWYDLTIAITITITITITIIIIMSSSSDAMSVRIKAAPLLHTVYDVCYEGLCVLYVSSRHVIGLLTMRRHIVGYCLLQPVGNSFHANKLQYVVQ